MSSVSSTDMTKVTATAGNTAATGTYNFTSISLAKGQEIYSTLVSPAASTDHQRCSRKREAFDVTSRRSEMNFVPDRGNRKLEMSVVREQWLACGGVLAANDPVVAAQTVPNFAIKIAQ